METYMNKIDDVIELLQRFKNAMGNCEFKIRIYTSEGSILTRVAGFGQTEVNAVELIVCTDQESVTRLRNNYLNQMKEVLM